jgi:hypothetical protein
MTDAEVLLWNNAVRAHAAGEMSDDEFEKLRTHFLTDIHRRIMTEDDYQGRTH